MIEIDGLKRLGFIYHGNGNWVYGPFINGLGFALSLNRDNKNKDIFYIYGQELKTPPDMDTVWRLTFVCKNK